MNELITEAIQNTISVEIFGILGIIIPIIIFILIYIVKNLKRKPIIKRLPIYIFSFLVMLIGLLSFIPMGSLTFNLLRDRSELVILEKEGYVNDILIYTKIPVIEIDNERFSLTPKIGKVKVGDYCEIEYLKYSKYIDECHIIKSVIAI